MAASAAVREPEKLTADEILRIEVGKPELLFPRDADKVKEIFRALAMRWYPERCPDTKAVAVLAHLKDLRDKALEKLKDGTWQEVGYFSCKLKDGKTFRVRADASRNFELGTTYICPTTLTYVVSKDHADLFNNAVKHISALKFLDNDLNEDTKMREVLAPCLPTQFKTYETEDSLILTVRKKSDDIRLRDLLSFIPKDKRDGHTAWIVNRLFSLVRYLNRAEIAHNGITLDTVYVSPKNHTAGLFGGWWYAQETGQLMLAAPSEAAPYLPDTAGAVRADSKVDAEMLRAVGRELLGDRDGTRLPLLKTAPDPMIAFLRMPARTNVQQDWKDYAEVLQRSFGAPRFVELSVTHSEVYPSPGA